MKPRRVDRERKRTDGGDDGGGCCCLRSSTPILSTSIDSTDYDLSLRCPICGCVVGYEKGGTCGGTRHRLSSSVRSVMPQSVSGPTLTESGDRKISVSRLCQFAPPKSDRGHFCKQIPRHLVHPIGDSGMNLCRSFLIKQKSESERNLNSIFGAPKRLGMSHNDPGSFLYQTLR